MRKAIPSLFLLLAATAAASPRPQLLVDASWLAAHLKDADLVLLHVGRKPGYDSAHIPGARYVSLDDISVSDHSGKGLMLEMPPADDLRQRLEKLGISDRSRIVVYYGEDWISPTTRVIFTLDYAGLGDRASLLDGGMEAWKRAGHPVTAEATTAKGGSLAPLKIHQIVADAGTVKKARSNPKSRVIDGRDAVYFDGIDTGGAHGQSHKTGHIAGAGSIPFTSPFDDRLMLRSQKELHELFAKAGVKEGDMVVAYCHIGQQATAVLFAARTLGHEVMLYDGSFEDWSRQADAPVENPGAK